MNTNNIQTRQTLGSFARTMSAGLGIAAILSFSAGELSARSNGRPTNNTRTASQSRPTSATSTGNRQVNIGPSRTPVSSTSHKQPVTSSSHQQPVSSAYRHQPVSPVHSGISHNSPSSFVDHGRSNNHSYVNVREGRSYSHIPEGRLRSSFGRGHEFRVGQMAVLGGHRSFRYAGVSFGLLAPWPARWQYSDAVYVDYIGGSYFLCNRMHPGVQVPVNVDECDACSAPVQPVAATLASCNCDQYTAQAQPQQSGDVPTLSRGQSADDVVAILGSPAQIVNLGIRQIFVYPNMRVTFVNGRMIDAR